MLTRLRSLLGPAPTTIALDQASPAKNIDCSEFEVDNWAVSRFVVKRLVPVVGIHPFPLNELMLMVATVCRFRPPMIFEWGTHIGKSARVFHETTAHYGIRAEIHSTDLPDEAVHVEHPGGERGKLVRGLPDVTLHQGDGLDTSLSVWRSRGAPASVLFFVDGDHSRATIARELAGIIREAPSAVVLLHDTFFQSPASCYNVGPHEAIADVLRSAPRDYGRVDSGMGLPGMTLLYPRQT